jgi:hypothetical protein
MRCRQVGPFRQPSVRDAMWAGGGVAEGLAAPGVSRSEGEEFGPDQKHRHCHRHEGQYDQDPEPDLVRSRHCRGRLPGDDEDVQFVGCAERRSYFVIVRLASV